MVYLELIKQNKNRKHKFNNNYYPIAVVRGDGRDQEKLLYVNTELKPHKDKSKKIELSYDNYFEVLPNPNEKKRDIYYIAGASGSGKSHVAKKIAQNYKKMYPDRKVYIVSQLEQDDTLDTMKGVKPERIPIDLVKDIEINNLSNCLFIFDDVDNIKPKEGGDEIQRLIDDIAIMGRSHTKDQGGVSMCFLTHYITNFKKTRLLLNEATHYILYPQATSTNQLYYILNKYLGFDRKEIKNLKKMNSRAVVIHKNMPQFMIGDYKAELLNQDD